MDKRIKFRLQTKISTIHSITQGRDSIRSAARRLSCSKSTVGSWLLIFQQHGFQGLSIPSRSHSGVFKVDVIQYMLENKLSLVRTAAFFGLNISVVYKWRQVYEQLGASGLLKENRGRKKSLMPKKKTAKKQTHLTDMSAEKQAALQKEVDYLRAENAYLKKLDALIQQEKTAQAQSKQQKSSRN